MEWLGVGGSGGRIIIDGDYMPTNSNWRVGGGIGDQKISSMNIYLIVKFHRRLSRWSIGDSISKGYKE